MDLGSDHKFLDGIHDGVLIGIVVFVVATVLGVIIQVAVSTDHNKIMKRLDEIAERVDCIEKGE